MSSSDTTAPAKTASRWLRAHGRANGERRSARPITPAASTPQQTRPGFGISTKPLRPRGRHITPRLLRRP